MSEELNAYLDFPYVRQVFRIERIVHKLNGSLLRQEVSFGIASHRAEDASPEALLQFNRGHWTIENRLHWVRDVTFDEDRSQVRRGKAAHAMASLRNLAISLLRMARATNLAAALRHLGRNVRKALRLIGL